jgi:hypothetical protein
MRLEGASVNTVKHGERRADSSEVRCLRIRTGGPALQPRIADVRFAQRTLKVYCQLRN